MLDIDINWRSVEDIVSRMLMFRWMIWKLDPSVDLRAMENKLLDVRFFICWWW